MNLLSTRPLTRDRCLTFLGQMSAQFAELKHKYADLIRAASAHPFTSELCNGVLSDSRLYVYLTLDLRFFLTSVRMLARTASLCDKEKSLVRLGRQIGFLCEGENEYFERTLQELHVSLRSEIESWPDIPVMPEIEEYIRFFESCINSSSYVENITAFYVCEFVYLLWAEGADPAAIEKLPYKHAEWIRLHAGPDFKSWVGFLESEVVRLVSEETITSIESVFKKTLELEYSFFDCCYNSGWGGV